MLGDPAENCKQHAWSVAAVVLGLVLILVPLGRSPTLVFVPQEEPIVRGRGAHHVFSTGERVSLVDFLAAEVRRARRGEQRLVTQPVLALTEVEMRRRRLKTQRGTGPTASSEADGDGGYVPANVTPVEQGYWRGKDGKYDSALGVERSTLRSPIMRRILVAASRRALFCPIQGVADGVLTDFIERAEGAVAGSLQTLASFSLRDRERFLTSKDIFRFVFVRHPFLRAASTHADGVGNRDLDSDEYRHFMGLVRGRPLSEHEHELQRMSMLFYLTFLGGQPSGRLDDRFLPQVDLCGIGRIDYELVGKLGTFEKDISTVAEKLGIHPRILRPSAAALDAADAGSASAAASALELFASSKHRTKASKLYAADLAALDFSATIPPPSLLRGE
jgi:Sulfotransferase family